MKTQEAIDFYGTKAELGRRLGIAPENFIKWGEYVPYLRACQLEHITKKKLKVTDNNKVSK